MNRTIIAAALISLTGSAALAQDGGLRFGLGVSTLGGGNIEAAYRLNDRWGIRGVYSTGLNANGTETIDGAQMNYNAKLGGFALMGDYYTGSTGFRVSGGAVMFNSSFDANTVATAANPITIGSTTLNSGERVDVGIEFRNRVAPILSVGYDWNMGKNFTISGELGAIATGGTNVSVSSNVALSQADIDQEVANIKGQQDLKAYPYVAITAGFRF